MANYVLYVRVSVLLIHLYRVAPPSPDPKGLPRQEQIPTPTPVRAKPRPTPETSTIFLAEPQNRSPHMTPIILKMGYPLGKLINPSLVPIFV